MESLMSSPEEKSTCHRCLPHHFATTSFIKAPCVLLVTLTTVLKANRVEIKYGGHLANVTCHSRLDNLLPTLSNHEIRRFREQLNNVTMQMDICSQLPVEILLNVASHLELEDIFTLRAVSQSWHVNFSNPDFCLGIIQKHFPYAWEQFANAKSIAGGEDSKKKRLLKWFQAAAMARRRRLHGRYHSTSTYYYNYTKANELTPEEQLERQYNNGKVAFRTRQSGILTRDLRTGQTSRFLEVNRKPIQEV